MKAKEYDRATASPTDRRLTELIADGEEVAVTEPVIMEVIAGARNDDREADLRRLLLRFHLLRFDPALDFDAAARIYRTCRRAGVTPRGMVDCMIASVARRHGVALLALLALLALDALLALLALDADLDSVAEIVGIEMDDPCDLPDTTRWPTEDDISALELQDRGRAPPQLVVCAY